MRQVWIPRVGPPEVLELREAPDPVPGPGQLRVRVAAAGVNFADILARIGLYPDAPKLPAVVGYEVAGTVDAVGPEAAGLAAPNGQSAGGRVADGGNVAGTAAAVGARVLALTHFGGYADTVVIPAAQAIPLPDTLSFEQGAALPLNYLTAWLMLVHLGNVRAGDRVLVHAAAGGVGQAALQICRWRGAEVIGTASAGKHERLLAAGAAHVIDYRREDFVTAVQRITDGRGVDLVLDGMGGASFRRSYRCLAPLGRLFMYGVQSFAPGRRRNVLAALRGLLALPTFRPVPLMNRNRGVLGVNVGHLWSEASLLRKILDEIVDLAAVGVLAPVVDRTFPLAEAAAAHGYIQDRRNFGKVLLVP